MILSEKLEIFPQHKNTSSWKFRPQIYLILIANKGFNDLKLFVI